MKLPQSLIEQCAAHTERDDAENRPSLTGVYYNAETQMFESANGCIAAFVPAPEGSFFPDRSFLIPPEAVAYYRVLEENEFPAFFIHQGDKIIVNPQTDKEKAFSIPDETFPKNLTKVIPNLGEMELVVSLDASYLIRLIKAVIAVDGNQVLDIYLHRTESMIKPIAISPHMSPDHVGVLMPIRIRTHLTGYTKPQKKK